MTDEPYADDHVGSAHPDPELRAALATLVADEPAAPPVQDDVARGRALQRRRRTRTGAALGLAAIVIGVAATGALLRPAADTDSRPSPAASSPTVASDSLNTAMRRAQQWFRTHYWSIVSMDVVPGSATTGREEVAFGVVPSGSPSQQPATVRVAIYPEVRPSGVYAERCTEALCDRGVPVFDCGFSGGIVCAADWVTVGDVPGVGAGARILDEPLRGGGGLLEVVAGADPAAATGPTPVLSEEATRNLVRALGNPYPQAPSAAPVVAPPCRAGDVKLIPIVAAAVEGWSGMVVEVHARNPEVRCTLSGYPAVTRPADVAGRPLRFDQMKPVTQVSMASVLVSQATSPGAKVRIAAYPCPEGGSQTRSLVVTLPGDDTAIPVDLPEGIGPVSCPRDGATGTPLAVSAFYAPEPDSTTTTSPGAVTAGLRGARVLTTGCAEGEDASPAEPVAITGVVRSLWVCMTANSIPVPMGSRGGVTAADSGLLDAWLQELRRPDGASTATRCTADLDVPRTVLAETSDGFWVVHLPRDGCDHYSRALVELMDAASGQQ